MTGQAAVAVGHRNVLEGTCGQSSGAGRPWQRGSPYGPAYCASIEGRNIRVCSQSPRQRQAGHQGQPDSIAGRGSRAIRLGLRGSTAVAASLLGRAFRLG
jgi:hypothetical protein